MYIFIGENKVQEYNGEILKRYVGKRLVKTIANPTDEDLKEFGYMEMIESDIPEYNPEIEYLEENYQLVDGKILKTYRKGEVL